MNHPSDPLPIRDPAVTDGLEVRCWVEGVAVTYGSLSGLTPYAAAISRVALTGSFSTLHNALRFAARGRQ